MALLKDVVGSGFAPLTPPVEDEAATQPVQPVAPPIEQETIQSANPRPDGPDWQGLFSDRKFYQLPPDEQFKVIEAMGAQDPQFSGMPNAEKNVFVRGMVDSFSPRRASEAEVEARAQGYDLVPRAAADPLNQPETLLAIKAHNEAVDAADPEALALQRRMAQAHDSGLQAGQAPDIPGAQGAVVETVINLLRGGAQAMDPIVPDQIGEFFQSAGKAGPEAGLPATVAALGNVVDLPMALAEHLTQDNSKMKKRWGDWRDAWKGKVYQGIENAQVAAARLAGFTGGIIGEPDLQPTFAEGFQEAVGKIDQAEGLGDTIAAVGDGLQALTMKIGSSSGQVAATAAPSIAAVAMNPIAGFAVAHSYLTGEAMTDIEQRGGEQLSPAELSVYQVPGTMLDMIGAKGMLKGLKPGQLGPIKRWMGNRALTVGRAAGTEAVTETSQQVANIMIRKHAMGEDIEPWKWGEAEAEELAETFLVTLTGTAGFVGGGQAVSQASQIATGRQIPGVSVEPTQAEAAEYREEQDRVDQAQAQREADLQAPAQAGAEGRVVVDPQATETAEDARFSAARTMLGETLNEEEQNAWVRNEPVDLHKVADRTGVDVEQIKAVVANAEEAATVATRATLSEATDEAGILQHRAAKLEEEAAKLEGENPELAADLRSQIENVKAVKTDDPTAESVRGFLEADGGPKVVFMETTGARPGVGVEGFNMHIGNGVIAVELSPDIYGAGPTANAYAITAVAMHEAIHNTEATAPEAYAQFKSLMKDELSQHWDESLEVLEKRGQTDPSENEIMATMAQLPGVAQLIVRAINSRASVEEEANAKPSKLTSWFYDLLDKINKWTKGKALKGFVQGRADAKSMQNKRKIALAILDTLEAGRGKKAGPSTAPSPSSEAVEEQPAPAEGVQEGESTVVESKTPATIKASDLAGGKKVSVTFGKDDAQTMEVSMDEDGKYVIQSKARTGKVRKTRRLNTMREVKAVLRAVKGKGGPQFSVSLPAFRQATGIESAPGIGSFQLERVLRDDLKQIIDKGDMSYDEAKGLLLDFDKSIKILEKTDMTKKQRALQKVAEKLGVKAIYYTGPRPVGTYGLNVGSGVVFIDTRNEDIGTTASTILHEAVHDLRVSNRESWDALKKVAKQQVPDLWKLHSTKVSKNYNAFFTRLGFTAKEKADAIDDETMSFIAGDHVGFFMRSMEMIDPEFVKDLGDIVGPNEYYKGELKTTVPAHYLGYAFAREFSDVSTGAINFRPKSVQQAINTLGVKGIEDIKGLDEVRVSLTGEADSNTSIHPQFSVATLPLWEGNYRAEASKAGATESEIEQNIKDLRFVSSVMALKPDLYARVDPAGPSSKDIGPLRENIGYLRTVDLDTICVRNLAWDAYRGDIEKAIGRPLTPIEKVAFARHLKASEKTVPCGYCYVESNREQMVGAALTALNAVEVIQRAPSNQDRAQLAREAFGMNNKDKISSLKYEILDHWRGTIPLQISPRLLVDEEYRKKAIQSDPRVEVLYKQIQQYMNGITAKLRHAYVPYTDEIFAKRMKQQDVDSINGRAGLRFFSSTDFKVDHSIDLMQIVTDAAVRGLKGHAYTKVTEFAEIFGDTNMKIGISVFAKGDKNIEADLREGANWNEAKRLRKKYPNVGTVMVITNDAQMEFALDQDWVDIIIPWHASSLNLDVGVGLEGWKNYSGDAHDKRTKSSVRGKGKNYVFDDHGNSVPKMKELAKKDGAELRYHRTILPNSGRRATDHPGYFKLVADIVRYDSPQEVMKPDFDMDAFERVAKHWQKEGGHEKLTKVDQEVIDSFIADVLPDTDKMAEAAHAEKKVRARRQRDEQKQAVKVVEFLESEDQTGFTRVNVPRIPDKHQDSLAQQVIAKASRMVDSDGVVTFRQGYPEAIVRKYFLNVKPSKTGFTAREPVQFSYSSNPQLSTGQQVFDPVVALPPLDEFGWLRKRLQDSFIQFKNLRAVMAELGLPYEEGLDVYLNEEVYHGRAANNLKKLDTKYVQPSLNKLRVIARAHKVKSEEVFKEFDDYLHARHARERNDQLKDVWVDRAIKFYDEKIKMYDERLKDLREEARIATHPKHETRVNDQLTRTKKRRADAVSRLADLKKAEAAGNYPNSRMDEKTRVATMIRLRKAGYLDEFKAVAKVVDRMLAERLDALLAEGLITQESYDNVKIYKYYVPLKALDKNIPGDIEQLFEMDGNWGSRAYDIRGDELRSSLGFEPGKGSDVNPIFTQSVLDTMAAFDRIERNRVGLSLLKLVQTYPNKQLWEINKAVKKKIFDKKSGRAKYIDDHWARNDPNVVAVKKDGQEYFITLYDAGLASAMKGLGVENVPRFLRAARSGIRIMAQLYTSLSPDFVISNFARDWQQARVSVTTDMSKAVANQVSKTSPLAIRAILHVNFPSRVSEPSSALGKELVRYYHEQKAEGGTVGFFALTGVEDLQKSLINDLNHSGDQSLWKSYRGLRKLMETVTSINEATENGIRLATYAAARKEGASKKKAASMAKNVTVNFNRKGDAAGMIGSLYMFFNAGIQGVQRTAQSFSTPVGKKLAVKLFFAGMATSMLARGMMGEDDDGKDLYDKISEHERSRHWIIPVLGGGYIKIPLPYGYGWFIHMGIESANILSAAIPGREKLHTAAAESMVRMLSGTTTHFSPVGEAHINRGWYGLVSPLIPSLVAPFADVAVNETYWGTPVYPSKSPWDRRAAAHRTWKTRGLGDKVFNGLFQGANKLFGGSKFRKSTSLTDINPEIAQYLWESYTGPAVATIPRIFKTAAMVGGGQEFRANDLPVARRFLGQVMPEYYIPSAYYDAVNDVMAAREEEKWYREEKMDMGRWRSRHGWKLKLATQASRTQQRINKLRKQNKDDDALKVQKEFIIRYERARP